MLTVVLALATVGAGLWAGFAAPPSRRSVLALASGAAFFFLGALGLHGWGLMWIAYALVIALPVVAARTAATKWSTPDIYDDE